MAKYLTLILLLPIFLFAQKKKDRDASSVIKQPGRIEFAIKGSSLEFTVVSGGKNGLLVVEETSDETKGGVLWNLHMLDTTFSVNWSSTSVVTADGSLLGYEYFDGNYYLLFSKNRYRTEQLLVYQIQAETKQVVSYEITTVFPIDIYFFESVGETLLIAGYANFRPVVITYNINDRIPKVVPGFYDNRNEILDLVVDDQSKLFTVIMQERMRNKRYTVRVRSFNEKADIVQDNLIDPGERISLLDGASTTFSGGLQYLAGTHSKKSLQYSQGFYLSKFINGQQHFNKYYAFADLDNFWEYLKPRREERIKRKIERKKEKGKTKRFNYRLLVHNIIERDDEYILIGEAYYPRYNYSTPSSFGNFNPGFPNSQGRNPFFLGYRYTHAVVVGFDRNCNIIWDHTFRIEDIQSYVLEQNVAVSAEGDRVVMMYLEENEIRSKVLDGNEIIEGRTFSPVKLSFEMDEVKSKDPSVEKIELWYDGTLYAYGEQSIRNSAGINGKNSRRVFYINKIQYAVGQEPN